MHLYFNRQIRKCAALFAVLVLSSVLISCTQIQFSKPLGDDVLFAVDDEECSLKEAIFRLMEYKVLYEDASLVSDFWQREIGSTTMAEYVKTEAQQEMLYYTVSRFIADDIAVYLTEEDRETAETEAIEAYEKVSAKLDTSAYGITMQTAIDLYLNEALYDKVYEKLADEVNLEISAADTKLIEVDYVLVPLGDKNAEETAESIRQAVKSGSDFEDACNSFGYTAELNQVIMKGSMSSEFEKVAFALTDSEVSDVVSDADGYYVIYCIEDYLVTESVSNYNETLTTAKRERFEETYTEYAAGKKLRYNDTIWDEISVEDLY